MTKEERSNAWQFMLLALKVRFIPGHALSVWGVVRLIDTSITPSLDIG